MNIRKTFNWKQAFPFLIIAAGAVVVIVVIMAFGRQRPWDFFSGLSPSGTVQVFAPKPSDASADAPGETAEPADGQASAPSGSAEPFGEIQASPWKAELEATVTSDIWNTDGKIGESEAKLQGTFYFDVDHPTETLSLNEAKGGTITVSISDDVPDCVTALVNDPVLKVETVRGTLEGTEFRFGKDFITVDHPEGITMSCAGLASFTERSASVLDLVKKHAFPVTVPILNDMDEMRVPFRGSFVFSGHQNAVIEGTLRVSKVRDGR